MERKKSFLLRLLPEIKYQLVLSCLQGFLYSLCSLLVYSYSFASTLNKTPWQELDVRATTRFFSPQPSRF